MRVRATKDGTYGGYLREGPIEAVPGVTIGQMGEVFDIDDRPYPAIDPETLKPIMEQVLDSRGNPIIDKVMVQAVDERGNPIHGNDKKPVMAPIERPRLRPKMWSWFSPEWMEKVSDDTPLTYDDRDKPRGVHPAMKDRSKKPLASVAAPVSAPLDLQEEVGKPIEEQVKI